MLERPFLLLTQDACPACERLKKMLADPLRGQFDDWIQVVHRQGQPEAFERLVEQYGVRQSPAMIRVDGGATLPQAGTAGLGSVKAFLQGGD